MFRIDISFSGDGVLLISPGNLLQKVLSEHMTWAEMPKQQLVSYRENWDEEEKNVHNSNIFKWNQLFVSINRNSGIIYIHVQQTWLVSPWLIHPSIVPVDVDDWCFTATFVHVVGLMGRATYLQRQWSEVKDETPSRYAHAEIRTRVVLIYDPMRYQLKHGNVNQWSTMIGQKD